MYRPRDLSHDKNNLIFLFKVEYNKRIEFFACNSVFHINLTIILWEENMIFLVYNRNDPYTCQ